MYLSHNVSPKYLWLIEMLIQIGANITCFVLILLCFPTEPNYDSPPETLYTNRFILYDLSAISETSNCSSSQSKQLLGTMKLYNNGCDCRNIVNEKSKCNNRICRFGCDKEEVGCITIDHMWQSIYKWRNKEFCTTDNNWTNYYILLNYTVKNGTQCYKGYKQCGILDNHDNIGCFPNEKECPINYLSITNSSIPPIEGNNIITKEINDGYYLHTSNEFTNNRLIDSSFQLGDGHACSSGYYNSEPYYVLEYDTCEKDDSYIKLDTLNKLEGRESGL